MRWSTIQLWRTRALSTDLRPSVRIVEVSPRDGLQNETKFLSVETRAALIARLAKNGLKSIEAGSFVSPRVKQMANTRQVLLHPDVSLLSSKINLPVLIPNYRGLQDFWRTLEEMQSLSNEASLREIAIFVAATDSFSLANLNATIFESLDRLGKVVQESLAKGIRIRGYVSCVAGVCGLRSSKVISINLFSSSVSIRRQS